MSSVCLSVRSSVTLVDCDHKDWKTWKLIAQTISRTLLLFVAKRRSTYSPGNMGTFGETRGGVGKRGVLVNKSGNISEMRKRGKVTMDWRAYIELTNALSNGTNYHPRRPPLTQDWVFATPLKTAIENRGETSAQW